MACLTLEYLANQRRRFAAVRLLASRHDVLVGTHEHRQPNPSVKTARIRKGGHARVLRYLQYVKSPLRVAQDCAIPPVVSYSTMPVTYEKFEALFQKQAMRIPQVPPYFSHSYFLH